MTRIAHSCACSALLASLARSASLIRSLARSLTLFGAHGKEIYVYELNASISSCFNPMWSARKALRGNEAAKRRRRILGCLRKESHFEVLEGRLWRKHTYTKRRSKWMLHWVTHECWSLSPSSFLHEILHYGREAWYTNSHTFLLFPSKLALSCTCHAFNKKKDTKYAIWDQDRDSHAQ